MPVEPRSVARRKKATATVKVETMPAGSGPAEGGEALDLRRREVDALERIATAVGQCEDRLTAINNHLCMLVEAAPAPDRIEESASMIAEALMPDPEAPDEGPLWKLAKAVENHRG